MIQVVHRTINILEFIARTPDRPRGLGEIAAAVQLNAATCARILKTLVATGYVAQIAPKKGYILGLMAYALSAGGPYRKDLIILAEPLMMDLVRTFQQTILLTALRHDQRVVLRQMNVGEMDAGQSGVQSVTHPYQSATGRLLVAYLPDAERRQLIQRLPLSADDWPEACPRPKLMAALDRIRADGWATRYIGETVGIAFPILGHDRALAALGMFLPEARFRGRHRERILQHLDNAAKSIHARIMKGGR